MDIIHILKFTETVRGGIDVNAINKRWNAYCTYTELETYRGPIEFIWGFDSIEQLDKTINMDQSNIAKMERFRICKRCDRAFRKEKKG